MAESKDIWPALPFSEWKATAKTLHMWTQIVGKIRLALTPWINHSWHVTLYLTARGLTTSPVPFGTGVFEIRFDFVSHELRLLSSDGLLKVIPLVPQTVAQFYGAVMSALRDLGIEAHFSTTPNEVDPAIPFEKNET
ncbi:MAG TPA: DUF5996 family protein, partial [Chthoniobacterales bacterium]